MMNSFTNGSEWWAKHGYLRQIFIHFNNKIFKIENWYQSQTFYIKKKKKKTLKFQVILSNFKIKMLKMLSCHMIAIFIFRDLSERSCYSLVGRPTLDSSEISSGSCRHSADVEGIFSLLLFIRTLLISTEKCNVFVQPWFVLLEKDIHCTVTPTPSPL